MKVLLIGGAGFIGKNLIEDNKIYELSVIDNLDPLIHGSNTKEIINYFKKNDISFLESDFSSSDSLEFIRKLRPAVIVMLASQTGTSDGNTRPDYYFNENVSKFVMLLKSMQDMDFIKRIINLSTRAVYGHGFSMVNGALVQNNIRTNDALNLGRFKYDWEYITPGEYAPHSELIPARPVSIYGTSKFSQEGILQSLRINSTWDFVILRLQNVVGRWQSIHNPYTGLTCWFVQAALENKDIVIYENGEIWRDFIDVRDVAAVILRSIHDDSCADQILDIGSGVATSLAIYAKEITDVLGSSSCIRESNLFRQGDIRWASADISKASKLGLLTLSHSSRDSIRSFVENM